MNKNTFGMLLRSQVSNSKTIVIYGSKGLFSLIVLWFLILHTQNSFAQEKIHKEKISTIKQGVAFNYIGNGEATFNLPRKSKLAVNDSITYSCDGQKEKQLRKINNRISINHKINLVGYFYNEEKKELCTITSDPVIASNYNLIYL